MFEETEQDKKEEQEEIAFGKWEKRIFLGVFLFLFTGVIAEQFLFVTVERKDFPNLSDHCYKFDLSEALICRIK